MQIYCRYHLIARVYGTALSVLEPVVVAMSVKKARTIRTHNLITPGMALHFGALPCRGLPTGSVIYLRQKPASSLPARR